VNENLESQQSVQKKLSTRSYNKDTDTYQYSYVRGSTPNLRIDILFKTGTLLIGQANTLSFQLNSAGMYGVIVLDMLPFGIEGFRSFEIVVRKYTTEGCVELKIQNITPEEMWDDDKGMAIRFCATSSIAWTPSLGDAVEITNSCAHRIVGAVENQLASIDTLSKAYASLTRTERKKLHKLLVDLIQEASSDEFYLHTNDIDAHEVLIRKTKHWDEIRDQRRERLLRQRSFMKSWRNMNRATAEVESKISKPFMEANPIGTKDTL
jgi:hypothetical protein